MIELFECERLSARISKAQCKKNRLRVDNNKIDVLAITACKGCPGLGSVVNIVSEVVAMAKNSCFVDGCDKQAQYNTGGMCKSHFTASLKSVVSRRSNLRGTPGSCDAAPSPVRSAVPPLDPISTLMVDVGVQTVGGPEIAIMRALRDVWAEKERAWLAELALLQPGAAIVRAAGMVQAVEGLGC